MPSRIVATAMLSATVLLGAAAPLTAGDVVLDESAYLRRYLRFGVNHYSAAALKAEGQKVLGQGGWDRIKRETEKAMQAKGLDPSKADWTESVLQPIFQNFVPTPGPVAPDGWTAVEFDDSAWPMQRGPFQGGPQHKKADITMSNLGQYDESQDLGLQDGYYRARFVVDDPEKAWPMTLRLTYAGGVIASVNGQEVARGHLPAGKLAADAPAEDYPLATYNAGGEDKRIRSQGPVEIPTKLIRKGVNVLAIEIRASQFHPTVLNNPRQPNWGGPTRPWSHCQLVTLELRGGAGAKSGIVRPPGLQAWAVDMHHRVESTEFLPPGEPAGKIRIVGARGGTYSAQVAIGTDKYIPALSWSWKGQTLVVRSPLSSTSIPFGNMTGLSTPSWPKVSTQFWAMAPFPVEDWTLKYLGDERGLGASFPDATKLTTFGEMQGGKSWLFDQLTSDKLASIPPNTCRPFWISFQVPPGAEPGKHAFTLATDFPGAPSVEIPIEVEVVDWALPAPRYFQTFVGCEENPYAVAKQYGVKLWSDEHFKLLDASFAQLARIGSRWINVPVILNTEFGNKEDSMVRWIRKKDKSLSFDYTAMDRYLDLAIKHCGPPRAINVVVMLGMKGQAKPPPVGQVKVFDETTGQTSLVNMDTEGGDAQAVAAWQAFAKSFVDHMKERKLEKVIYWGSPLEGEADKELKNVLAKAAPGVGWVAGPHEMMSNGTFAKDEKFYKLITTIRYWGGWQSFRTDMGWKSPTPHMLNPRVGGTIFGMHTTSTPFAYRVMPDRAVAFGRSGFTRVGVDEWAAAHFESAVIPKWQTGVPVLFTLWPGKDGAQSSARFEALIEGVQEAEARIFLEQAIDKGKLTGPAADKARKVLADNLAETMFFQGNSMIRAFEEYHYRWQERSSDLYHVAAEAAKALVAGR